MKYRLALLLALAPTAWAQTNVFVTGSMDIKYNSRLTPVKGATDVYGLNINVCNSAVFRGAITFTPFIDGTVGITQNAQLGYDLATDVVNPANPSQTRNIGRLYGVVPISPDGLYNFNTGSLKFGIVGIGQGQGFESAFKGTAQGRPLKKKGFFDNLKSEALSLTRTVNGKTVKLSVTKYDRMTFNSVVLAQGPVQVYPESTVQGEMVYDYSRYAWHFNGLTITYYVNGKPQQDRITGNIRWQESPKRSLNGEGWYEWDMRFNEPPPNEAAAFSVADEASFFTTDNTIPALTGVMKYKDTLQQGTVTGSAVQVQLVGNQISRVQAMNAFKVILLSVVPINAE